MKDDKNSMCACGMHLCGKCGMSVVIFGLLFLVAGLGLWTGAPAWWNGWTIVGAFMVVWAGATMMKM